MVRRFLLLAACLVGVPVAAGVGAGAGATEQNPQAQQPQRPTFTTRIDTVSVDVHVTDKNGQPVTDLTADDFEIEENKKAQTIDTFKLIEIDDGLDPDPARNPEIRSLDAMERETSREDVRIIAIFLDDYHTRLGNSMAVREKLARFVRDLNPRDLVALMTPLLPTTALTFSRNHEATAQQIMSFYGRKYDYTPKAPAEEVYMYMQPRSIEILRNQIVTTALEGLSVYLGTLREGRKTILFVSEGLITSLPAGVNTTGITGVQGGSPTSPTLGLQAQMEAQRALQGQWMNLLDDLKLVFAAASRSNTSIYTLDPRGLASQEFSVADQVGSGADRQALTQSLDVLHILADNTDGRALVSTNDPLPGLKQMLRDSSSYYLLGYTSTEAPRDGKFHPIKVSVKRKGVDVRARNGYWAYNEDDVEKAAEPVFSRPPEVEKAFDAIAEPAAGRAIRTWLAADKRDDGRSDVTLVWEALRTSGPDVPAQVTVTASAANGDLVHRGRVGKVEDPAGRVVGTVTFAAPPGPLMLRLSAENADGDALDTDTREWTVPDFAASDLRVSTPRLYRGRTARNIQILKAAAAPVPETSRTFSRTERLLVRFEVYGPGAAPTMRLLNRNGDAMSDWPVTAREGGGSEAEVSLGGIAPGDYLLEISASAAADAPKALVAFHVTS